MRTSQKHQTAASISGLFHHPSQDIDFYQLSQFQILENNVSTEETSSATPVLSCCNSPSGASVSSRRVPLSDPLHSSDNAYGSPMSGSSSADDSNEWKHKLRELEISLLGPEPNVVDSCYCCFKSGSRQGTSHCDEIMTMIPKLDLRQVLIACAQAVADADTSTALGLMEVLGQMVSVSGDPMQRLGAYMLEGLRARLESSGSSIYRALKCEEPTSSELMSYMHILFQMCPYWKFAYTSANAVILQAMANESRIHIIDFQVAQGTQWIFLMHALAGLFDGPPSICITGIDDSRSFHARGGGLHSVGERLAKVAESYGIPFEFHSAAMSGCEVDLQNLRIQPGEALAVNFPYVLHHMPDESVTTENHRDRLLRLVKSLSPKVVTLVEQESNTNTSPFFQRFCETLDYYTAMFESIDVARPRDDKNRISAEQQCVARDIVNMIACELAERVERHELIGKWRLRFNMAGFTPYHLSSSVTNSVKDMLRGYSENYRVEERDGALYLGWKGRDMTTSSAWS